MLKRLVAAAFTMVIASAAGAAERTALDPITLDDFGGRLRSVHATVNGQTGVFTIDTGGGISLVTPEFAKRIGCRPWGALTGFRLSGERLDLPRCDEVAFELPSGERLTSVAAGVVDLRPLLFKDAPPVDGSIALDALEGRAFTLDLGNGTLTMETPESLAARTKGAAEIPLRLVRQAGGRSLGVVVPVATARGDLWMALDSGGGPPVLLRDRVAAEAGADPAVTTPEAYELVLRGGETVKVATRAIVRDMILDGVIGMPVLVRWRLTIDLVRNRLWITSTRP